MFVKETHIHDEIMQLVDLIDSEPDPAARLAHIAVALNEVTTLLKRSRDAASYDCRIKHSTNDLETALGINRGLISMWARRYQEGNRLPALPDHRRRQDLAEAIDLSGLPARRREALSRATSSPG